MSQLVILGASGFVGRYVLRCPDLPNSVKAVAREIPADVGLESEAIKWYAADLLRPGAIDSVLETGDTVINLAYLRNAGDKENLVLVDNVTEACVRRGAARLLHCSTAAVVGASPLNRVTESTRCVPKTAYERVKLLLEERVLNSVYSGLDVGIMRPTAIVGPGGQNLLKLARALQERHRVSNYLRACLFGTRPMHLVPVSTVARAALHLALFREKLDGNIYIVSADDDGENNFLRVEEALQASLGLGFRTFPLIPLPKQLLSVMVKLLRRSGWNMDRVYESKKLLATGFVPKDSIDTAVREFGNDLRATRS